MLPCSHMICLLSGTDHDMPAHIKYQPAHVRRVDSAGSKVALCLFSSAHPLITLFAPPLPFPVVPTVCDLLCASLVPCVILLRSPLPRLSLLSFLLSPVLFSSPQLWLSRLSLFVSPHLDLFSPCLALHLCTYRTLSLAVALFPGMHVPLCVPLIATAYAGHNILAYMKCACVHSLVFELSERTVEQKREEKNIPHSRHVTPSFLCLSCLISHFLCSFLHLGIHMSFSLCVYHFLHLISTIFFCSLSALSSFSLLFWSLLQGHALSQSQSRACISHPMACGPVYGSSVRMQSTQSL